MTTIFNEEQVWRLFDDNLIQAQNKLTEIDVFCGQKAKFAGLSGWVFEQTIAHCIIQELKAKGVNADVREQVSLGGRAKADLAIGAVAIELKTSGLFGMGDVERYRKYKNASEVQGFRRYLYLTWEETFLPYKDGLDQALGKNNVFYLKNNGEWQRVISVILNEVSDTFGDSYKCIL